jgi:uncharacterized phage infection (PIP) family protein YhgE
MAGLDNIPQKQSIEIEIAKLDESILYTINSLNDKSNQLLLEFGQIYIRKQEIADELIRLDSLLEKGETTFKNTSIELKEILESLDDKYPAGRLNLQDGTVQYQPGAPTRKQLAEQQAQQQQQQSSGNGMKVVKE